MSQAYTYLSMIGKILNRLWATILEAVFPLSEAEKEVFSYTPKEAHEKLPPSPPIPVSDTKAVFAYKDERVSRLVWNIKYKKSEKAVKIGGYALYQALLKELDSDALPAILIPLPITFRRRRERGYNQCELLIDEIMRLLNLNSTNNSALFFVPHYGLLERIQHKSRQALKGRTDRLLDAKGIFAVKYDYLRKMVDSDPQLMNRHLIVIDDVITTGSTITEAIETLKTAGLKYVTGMALAH